MACFLCFNSPQTSRPPPRVRNKRTCRADPGSRCPVTSSTCVASAQHSVHSTSSNLACGIVSWCGVQSRRFCVAETPTASICSLRFPRFSSDFRDLKAPMMFKVTVDPPKVAKASLIWGNLLVLDCLPSLRGTDRSQSVALDVAVVL